MNSKHEKTSMYYTKIITIAIIAMVTLLAVCGVGFAEDIFGYVFVAPLAIPIVVGVMTGGVPGLALYIIGLVVKIALFVLVCNLFVKFVILITGTIRRRSNPA